MITFCDIICQKSVIYEKNDFDEIAVLSNMTKQVFPDLNKIFFWRDSFIKC